MNPIQASEATISEEYRNSLFNRLYDVSFEEKMLDRIARRWFHIDIIFRFILAVTASGSTVGAWYIWETEYFRTIWAIIVSLGALIAIVNGGVLHVQQLLKDADENGAKLRAMRLTFESMWREYNRRPETPTESDFKKLEELTHELNVIIGEVPRIPFVTRWFRNKTGEIVKEIFRHKEYID